MTNNSDNSSDAQQLFHGRLLGTTGSPHPPSPAEQEALAARADILRRTARRLAALPPTPQPVPMHPALHDKWLEAQQQQQQQQQQAQEQRPQTADQPKEG